MFCSCSSRQQSIHICYTCLTLFVLFPLTTRHCIELSSIQPKLKSVRSLSKLLTVATGRCISVFSTSNDYLVQDLSLDKGASDFQVVNKPTHNFVILWAVNQTGSFVRKTVFVRRLTHTRTRSRKSFTWLE
jgi:hypothetical protein